MGNVIPFKPVTKSVTEWLREFNDNVDEETRAELDYLDMQEKDRVEGQAVEVR